MTIRFHPSPARRTVAALALVGALGSVAHAQTSSVQAQHKLERTIRADQVPRVANLLRLATYPDGGYISDINGRRRNMTVWNGMMLVINGKGFDVRKPASNVALFDGVRTTGAMLKIWEWSDTRIAVEIPVDQTALTRDTSEARLLIQGVRPNNVWTRYEVKGIAFDADR